MAILFSYKIKNSKFISVNNRTKDMINLVKLSSPEQNVLNNLWTKVDFLKINLAFTTYRYVSSQMGHAPCFTYHFYHRHSEGKGKVLFSQVFDDQQGLYPISVS